MLMEDKANEIFPYHAVDIYARLEQGLDSAVVSVARSQMKRSVLASVAGHEVGVSAHQHAHHLRRKGGHMSVTKQQKQKTLEEAGPLDTFFLICQSCWV